MASGGRAKRFRGNHTHGRGKKAGRGAGLKGGRGRAGANKHRFLMLQILGGKHEHLAAKRWGRIGFKFRSRNGNPKPVAVNVGDLAVRWPGQAEVDLKAQGIGILITDHNVRETLSVTDRAYIINEGKIFRHGTPDQLGSDSEVRRVYLGESFSLV
jgi:ribosomal protein L15